MENKERDSQIINVDIEKEMQNSFLAYSMSVIVSRALPDVRDGLKPVHRRILYTLFENNLGPEKPYRKCADTVGAVLGRYHPHGDTSVYDALVRLAQDFSTRYTLVDGHGNFGSVDGDPPAAYRYTESRMSKISVNMLTDIEKETVDFLPNYDDRLKEPAVLPSRFPNLLVNGSTGIAVGMATNIPPHNLGEVIDAVCHLIDNKESSLEELMEFIKGPDFPTGANILGNRGIKEAYSTGRGKLTIRACASIEEEQKGRQSIVVTELPYQVNKARLCEGIANLVKEKKIEEISNIEDHSDRNGMHIKISLKRDANAQVVLNKLYSFTQMQITFGVILLAIVNGEPKILTLRDMLQHYIDFQVQVITRRTQFDLKKARDRAHILEALKVAIDFIDEVIAIIRGSKSIQEAKTKLMERFKFDEVQAQAIVQMRLGQLTGLEREKIEQEIKEIIKMISFFEEILGNQDKLFSILKEELLAIKKKFQDERRTKIIPVEDEIDIEDLIPNEPNIVTLTKFGYLKRQGVDNFKTQKRGGRGISSMNRREEDFAAEMFTAMSHDNIMFFSNYGRVYKLKCYKIPEGSRVSRGTNAVNLLPLEQGEKISSIIRAQDIDEDKYLVLVTKNGVIKRTKLGAFSSARKKGVIAILLDEGDELAWVNMTGGNDTFLVSTQKGMSIRFSEKDVRASGRSTRGVRAIRLKEKDIVVGLCVVGDNSNILTVSETGYGRISPCKNYRLQSRGGKGIINYHTEKYGNVASVQVVGLEDDVVMISDEGILIRMEAKTIRECARPSKGVRVMRTKDESKVVAVAKIPAEIKIKETIEQEKEE